MKKTTIYKIASGVLALQVGSLLANEEAAKAAQVEKVEEATVVLRPVKFAAAKSHKFADQKMYEAFTFADFDGDGKMDAISGNYPGNLMVRKNTGEGKFAFGPVQILARGEKRIKLKHW